VFFSAFALLCGAALFSSSVASASSLTISGSPPKTATAGSVYSFTPSVVDSLSGRTLSFAIVDKPAWASFSSSTGKLTGTPTAANVGKFSNIEIAVNDGLTSAVLPSFAVTVSASGGTTTKDTVTISGTPSVSVTEGKTYSFQPSAKDSVGKTLSYSVSNKPSWATFSIATGLLTGTPTATGTFANIVVSASDGTATGTLPAFSITVVTPTPVTGNGSATLAWTDPTLNTNGSSLTNLAGVHLFYGQSQTSMTNEITVPSTSENSYTVSGLSSGTWYFAATAYTTTGVQSAQSAIGTKTIQ